MMKLSTMSAIIDTRRESPRPPDALTRLWFADHGPLEFVRISANCVLRFEARGETYFLRLNSDYERKPEQLEAEIRFVNYLATNGIPVARPVLSSSGRYVESMQSSAGLLHALVFEAAPGRIGELAELSDDQMVRWGHALGELHRAAQGYTHYARRCSWREHIELIEHYLPRQEHDAWRQLAYVKAWLSQLPITSDNYGLIHYDFELDNILWDGDAPGIIDFDDCAHYWFTADTAFALRDLFEDRADRVNLSSERFRLFARGYIDGRGHDPGDFHLIPLFLRLHNLTCFSKLVRTLEDGVQPDEPPWMDGLRTKLLGVLQRYRGAFADYGGLD